MDNYVLTRVACGAVFRMAFAVGTGVGGAAGIALGLLEQSAIGVCGGAFFGLAVGLSAGLAALAGAAVFNLLVPYLGGVPVRLEPAPVAPAAPAEQPGRESPA